MHVQYVYQMNILYFSIISVTILLSVNIVINHPVQAACLVGSDWPSAPCYDLPGHQGPSKEILREQWAPYYQYKGDSWMQMMKTQMIDAIKNGTINTWTGHSDAADNVWTYYSLNDQVPFFIQPGAQNYTRPDHMTSPLQQFKSGTPVEDTQCKQTLVLWLKQDGTPICATRQSSQVLLQRDFLSSDSYKQFAINESKRFVRSSPTFESSAIPNTLKLTVQSVEESFPPIILIDVTFDSSSPGYGDKSVINAQPYLTHHTMSITVSDTNRITSAIIDKQWDELSQKFLRY